MQEANVFYKLFIKDQRCISGTIMTNARMQTSDTYSEDQRFLTIDTYSNK